jgi:transmembrane sensor
MDRQTPNRHPTGADGPEAEAAAWVVRLQDKDAGETEWLSFDAWLAQSPDNPAAYDRALALWHELDRRAPNLKRRLAAPPVRRRGPVFAGAALVAATLALGWLLRAPHPSVDIYQTVKGERKTAALADGSHIDLAAATHLSVVLAATERRVTLDEGEAIFDVAPDANRPFIITAGDRQIRVVGTEFDVRRRGDQLSVTVRRGVVEITPLQPSQSQTVRLLAGNRADHQIGSAATRTSAASPDDVFAWRGGHLIYRDRPLSEVAADLNAQFDRPISLADSKTANLRFSGVILVDDEENTVHRLTLLAPLWSTSAASGIMVGTKDTAAQ